MLLGLVVAGGLRVTVRGCSGTVRATAGDELEFKLIVELLASFDGQHSIAELINRAGDHPEMVQSLVGALTAIDAIEDACSLWRSWARASWNPPKFASRMTVEAAYQLPVWSLNGDTASSGDATEWPNEIQLAVDNRKRSLELASARVADPTLNSAKVKSLAAQIMRPRTDGHLIYSSAGAMWPIFLWVISQDPIGRATVSLLDHWSMTATITNRLGSDELSRCFVPDAALLSALAAGASIVVVTAQMDRVCGKYGSRGWNYALMEAGQVLALLEQNVDSLGLSSRVCGGFYEEEIIQVLTREELIPLACVFIADRQ